MAPGVAGSPTWKIPVIVVCTIVGFILLILLPALVIVLCVRRYRKHAAKGKEEQGTLALQTLILPDYIHLMKQATPCYCGRHKSSVLQNLLVRTQSFLVDQFGSLKSIY
jgi:hypothetical protein